MGGGKPKESPVQGERILSGLIACNHVPDEILTDHPDRFRAMLIESANPVHSLAGSQKWRDALDALDFAVCIDVAMTETARRCDYVLPAASQYEKAECTFFTLEFPENDFQLRHPVFEPLEGTLPEPEIHARLVKELGVFTDDELEPLREAAKSGAAGVRRGVLRRHGGQATPEPRDLGGPLRDAGQGGPARRAWRRPQRCGGWRIGSLLANGPSLARAGYDGETLEQGEKLFQAIIDNPQGIVFSVDPVRGDLEPHGVPGSEGVAGGRRAGARTPGAGGRSHGRSQHRLSAGAVGGRAPVVHRQHDHARPRVAQEGQGRGAAHLAGRRVGARRVEDGSRVRVVTRAGAAETVAEVSDTMRSGHISLPNGFGLDYPDEVGEHRISGIAPNELTSIDDRDWFAGTPHHKHVPARVELVG